MTTTAHHPTAEADHVCPFPVTGCTARTCRTTAGLIRVQGGVLNLIGRITIGDHTTITSDGITYRTPKGTLTIPTDVREPITLTPNENALAAAAAQIDRAWGLRDFPGPRRRRVTINT